MLDHRVSEPLKNAYVCMLCRAILGHGGLIDSNVSSPSPSEAMSKLRIKVARIETARRGKRAGQVCVTFQVNGATGGFQVPILLSIRDFDDTEMVQAARSALHRTFAELASQSQKWKLSAKDLKQLSRMSLRPKP